MKKVINGVEFLECMAIALEAGDTEAQKAIFAHDRNDTFRNGDCVIFGYQMPESAEDVETMFNDVFTATTDEATMNTVKFI